MRQINLSLEKFFPKTWTHPSKINWLGFMFALKLADYDWRELSDVAEILAFMQNEKLIEVNSEHCIRLAPR